MTPRKAAPPPPPPTLEATLSANIREARKAREWAQDLLAAKMSDLGFDNWSRMTVTTIERGDRRVTIEEWLGLAEVFRWAAFQFLLPQHGESSEVAITPKFSMEDDASFFAAIVDEELLAKVSHLATGAAWKMAMRTVRKRMIDDLKSLADQHRQLAEQSALEAEFLENNPELLLGDFAAKEKP